MRLLEGLPTPLLALVAIFSLPLARADHDDPSVKIEVTTPAGCSRPTKSGDKISVHYIGTLESTGVEFDQSYKRGSPISFVLGAGRVIKGWDEGLLDMCPGEGRRLTIPPELGYGKFGSPPVIPGDATLVFETELVDIVGVQQENLTFATTATDADFSIATAPPTPPSDEAEGGEEKDESLPELGGTPLTDTSDPKATQQGQCHLLGPFALIVQGALGLVALLSLVFKRWRETPKRPWKIWFFDVSKQVVGSVLTHILNLVMSMLGAMEIVNAAAKAADKSEDGGGGHARRPNPCSFYLLNLAIDTTLGIPILYLLLKVLHVAFLYTPLAKPPESIKSGNYGQPPKVSWWLKQSLIYFIGLTGMKLFVLFLFAIFPWLPWVGDWALRWTEGNEAMQIAFAMFIFPVAMNGVQYWIIDNFIMDKERGKEDSGGYQQVRGQDDDDDSDMRDDETVTVEGESVRGKDSDDMGRPPLMEANPTPIPDYDEDVSRGEGSRGPSPAKEADGASRRS